MFTEKSRKIIITGNARAGTGFLVELLTELGLDTGYTPRSQRNESVDQRKASEDRDVESVSAPYIVKDSKLAAELPAILARGHVTIDYALVPIRQMDETYAGHPGTAENVHTLVETLAAHDIPNAFLHFPRFAHDSNYTFAKLRPLLGEMSREEFAGHFARVAKPDVLRAILEGLPEDRASNGQSLQQHSVAPRILRRARQVTAACSLVTLGWIAAGWNDDEKTSVRPTTTASEPIHVATRERPHAANFPLPSFRSPPLRVSESLSLATMDIYPERSFPSRFGPMNMLNRPTANGLGFRREALKDIFRR